MKKRNVTVLTTTMDLGAPYNEVVALRGLLPLHAPLQQRLLDFDGTVDLVRCGRAINFWIPLPVLEFMLFDFDRVLRGGGYLWLDHFFSKGVDFNRVYKPLFGKLGYKIMDKIMDLSEYNKKDIITSATHTSFASGLKSTLEKHRVLQRFLLVLSLIGACMVIGDGVLTPAISVFSAVSGLELSMSKEHHKFFYASVSETSEIIHEDNYTIRPKAARSGEAWEKASEELNKSWRERGFSSLIVAAPELSP